jgi:hypothetical protein
MLFAALIATLAAEPSCDVPPKAPALPAPSQFACPQGATAKESGEGLITCLRKDGKETGDSLLVFDGGGILHHPDGLSISWVNDRVRFFVQNQRDEPAGPRVQLDASGALKLYELYGADGKLLCARYYDGARLKRRIDGAKETWFDAQGKPIDLKVPLSKEEISDTIREHSSEVKFCYEKRLQEVKGELQGTVSVEFDIQKGAVSGAKLAEDGLRDPGVTDCMLARIAKWRFRPANEATSVTFPWVFKKAEGK